MSGFTGVEFGPDSCTLVRARRRAEGTIELTAAHIIEPSEWPSQAAAAADLLKRIRVEKAFPRVARVIPWGLAEGAGPRDIATRAALRPLIAAGFRIGAVMSPPQALAIMAADRPRASGAAAVWLAINRHGAALAIVRGAELLYSRAFGWNWDGAAIGSQAQLLQRYSIVAHLAPEVRRGVDMVRTRHDVAVEAAVTCGDLPDLRSLTMPLIEELDLEVETLDSADGLIIPTTARREHLPDSLSPVRLACAAAAGRHVRGLQVDVVGIARAAAYVAAVASLGWIGYVWWARPQPAPNPDEGRTAVAAASTPPERRAPPPIASQPLPAPPTASGALPGASPGATQPTPIPPAAPPASAPASAAPPRRTPPAEGTSPQAARRVSPTAPSSAASRPATGTDRRPSQTTAAPDPPRPRQAPAGPTDTSRTRPAAPQPSAAAPPRRPVEAPPPPVIAAPQVDTPAARAPRPAPLKDPLPVIDTILVSSDRRLAVIDGAFVGIGDTLGQRTVARIEVDAVFFREPSGLEIRVPIRMRREP